MDHGLEKYRHLREFTDMAQIDLQKLLRMVDTLLEEVPADHHGHSSPALCSCVCDQALRIRALLSSRLVALEDLVVHLREQGLRP